MTLRMDQVGKLNGGAGLARELPVEEVGVRICLT